ncbi:MAG: class I SAM-dependent methyltransferase [Candidatus Aureabacteria bacterium]|nr:class I SAM-dependent methyltransferase [Candidatus Auribacterota bacterium]
MRPVETVMRDFLGKMPSAHALVRTIEYLLLSRYEYSPPVMDIGCGDGFFGSYLFKDRNQIIDLGVDLNLRRAQKAKNSGGYREILTCNASDIPYPDAHFQSIFSNCVFEHMPNLVEVFMEIRRLLKPGGNYIFTTHSNYYNDYLSTVRFLRRLKCNSLASLYIKFINAMFKHFNCLSPEEWQKKLNKAGLALVHYEYYLGPSTLGAWDHLLPLAAPSYIWYAISQRYTLLPRAMAQLIFHRYLCRLAELKESTGGGLLMIAQRK